MYFEVVVCTVAVVPNDNEAKFGLRQPLPMVSQPLSEPEATIGKPFGIPVSFDAIFVTSPYIFVGSMTSGSLSFSMGNMKFLTSFSHQLNFLKSNGTYPICDATESLYSPVSLYIR